MKKKRKFQQVLIEFFLSSSSHGVTKFLTESHWVNCPSIFIEFQPDICLELFGSIR
jgi:hypothetical protein